MLLMNLDFAGGGDGGGGGGSTTGYPAWQSALFNSLLLIARLF